LFALAYALARDSLQATALALLCLTAPLEVYRTPVAGFNISLFRLSLIVALLVIAFRTRSPTVALMRRKLFLGYVCLLILMIASLLALTENTYLGVRLIGQVSLGVLAVLLVAGLTASTSLERFASLFVVGAIVPLTTASAQGILDLLDLDPTLPFLKDLPAAAGLESTREALAFARTQGVRLKGTFGDPNHFGVYMMIAAGTATSLAVLNASRGKRLASLTYLLLAAASSLMMLASYSRTAWLGAAVGVFIFVILAHIRLKGQLHMAARRILIAGLLSITIVALPLSGRIAERSDPTHADNVSSNRTHTTTTRVAFRQYLDHPIAGIGVSDLGPVLDQTRRTSGAHSSFLTAAAELGTLGLILLLALGIGVIAQLMSAQSQVVHAGAVILLALTAVYAGFLVSNLTYDLWWDDFHFLLIGAALSMAPISRRDSEYD
jgi:hypothetical protein